MTEGRGKRNLQPVDYKQTNLIISDTPSIRKRNATTTKDSLGPPQFTVVKKKSPARYINGFKNIESYFNEKIKDQATSIRKLAAVISGAINSEESAWGPGKPLVYGVMLAGTSGCGKTETVAVLRNFLGMDTGFEYEKQYIEIDGSAMQDETQVNSMTGAAAGLIGYRDGTSLADRLNTAIREYRDDQWYDIQKWDKASVEYRTACQDYNKKLKAMKEEERPVPPYILIAIDELDKVSNTFLLSLNGFLETGHYNTISAQPFRLPQKTRLIVAMTSNYGAKKICAMKQPDDDEAVQHIISSMRKNQLEAFSIVRLGQLLPYYPLKPEVMRQILIEKLESFIQSKVTPQWGNNVVSYSDTAKDVLVNSVLSKMHSDMGLRGGLKQLCEKLNLFFENGLAMLSDLMDSGHCQKPTPEKPIHIETHEFTTTQFNELVDKKIDSLLQRVIKNIKEDPVSSQALTNYQSAERHGIVSTVGMRYEKTPLCNFVVSITSITVVHNHKNSNSDNNKNNNNNEHLQNNVERLRKEKRALKDALRDITEASKKEPHKEIDHIIKNNHELLQSSSSDESEEENDKILLLTNPSSSPQAQPQKKRQSPRHTPTFNDKPSSSLKRKLPPASFMQELENLIGYSFKRPRVGDYYSSEEEEEEYNDDDDTSDVTTYTHSYDDSEDLFMDDESEENDDTIELGSNDTEEEYEEEEVMMTTTTTSLPKEEEYERKDIGNFTRAGSKGKHPKFVCNECYAIVDKRFLDKHLCK
jgi:hypothetical protein